MAEFEIKVQELDAGGKQYDFPIRRAWLDATLRDPEADPQAGALRGDPGRPEGDLSVFAEKSGEDVVVRGRVQTHLLAECARCLGDAPIAIDTEIVALYTARKAHARPVADEDELTPEELEREFYTGDKVVLDALVREHVLLEVPMQPLCSETCEGLAVPESVRGPADLAAASAAGGEGERVDPRLAPLRELAKKLDPKKRPS